MKRLNGAMVLVLGCAGFSASFASAQVALELRVVDPGVPNRIVVDIFADVADADIWESGGFRGVSRNGATFHYGRFDDPNTPQPDQLIGPYGSSPVTDRYVSCFSQPRAVQEGQRRFNQGAGAAITGRLSPPGAIAVASATEINVAYERTLDEPSTDGYVGRIALNVFDVPQVTVRATPISEIFPGSIVFMVSEPAPGFQGAGTVSATRDAPDPSGLSWAIWAALPEPSTGALLAVALALLAGCRR